MRGREYVTRVADTGQVVEGKFDTIKGKDVLVLTGRFGFKTSRRERPGRPEPGRLSEPLAQGFAVRVM